jgi:hypothetical protein
VNAHLIVVLLALLVLLGEQQRVAGAHTEQHQDDNVHHDTEGLQVPSPARPSTPIDLVLDRISVQSLAPISSLPLITAAVISIRQLAGYARSTSWFRGLETRDYGSQKCCDGLLHVDIYAETH